MTKGGLLRWHVKEGAAVESGDTIAEIETDKATLDFDTMDEGIVAKILVAAGTKDIEVTHIDLLPTRLAEGSIEI